MRNRPNDFEIYLVNFKTIRTIAQIFVAFSEKLNFTFTVKLAGNLFVCVTYKDIFTLDFDISIAVEFFLHHR